MTFGADVCLHSDTPARKDEEDLVTATNTVLSIPDIRAAVAGRVIGPDDPDYDRFRTVVMGGIDRRPAVIVCPANTDDVATVIRLARETGLPLAVRSGGHSSAGHSVVDDGIVLDLRDMKRLEIDVENRTAWAEAGLTAGEYTARAAEHGLATGFGDTGSVGIGGITLGGGVGYLVRKHGLTIDSLLAADIVTADGQVRRVDAEHEPDLFWAIRGGGGNFGVVTRFQFRLHDVSEFTGGILVLPATADTIAGFIAANEAAPEELSAIANVMPCPPMPFVPEEHHGTLVILAMLAFAGPADAAAQAYAPFRALATPLADLIQAGSYTTMYPPEPEEEYHPTAIAKNLFMDAIDRDVAQGIVDTLESIDAPMKVAQLRVLGGAYARVPAEATAYAHRASRIMVNIAAFYMGEDDRVVKAEWVDRFARQLTQTDHGAYVNFVGDEGEAGVRAAYPGATYGRLAEIKRRYDPDNLFRLNQNIVPA